MQRLRLRKVIIGFAALLLFFLTFLFVRASNFFVKPENKNRISVFTAGSPDSLDPLKYDSFVNHVAFTSVNGNLVSQYKLGEHSPDLAQSWTVNENHTEWVFKIRPNMTFSDGSPITGQIVLVSWLRMAKLMKSQHSNSGFFEYIVGYENLESDSESIKGLSASDDFVKISLSKPMPKLLDKISFGLYSIIHPSHFDRRNGQWLMGRENLITSGPYKIKEWNETRLVLSLRKEYPSELIHPNPLKEIEIFWKRDVYPNDVPDILMGSDLVPPPKKEFVFQGAPPSSIQFMRVLSWRDPGSVFYHKNARIQMRNLFYKQMEEAGVKPIRSFFPLIIRGTRELADLSTKAEKLSGKVVMAIWPQKSRVAEILLETMSKMGLQTEKKEASFAPLMEEIKNAKIQTTWDISGYGTGILASDPLEDVRFMFKSKEGILLPDETGEILKELEKETVDLQRINELLWEQGLIWPVLHYSSGLWVRPDLDFSEVNLVLPPTAFQWIGWKN